MATDRDPPPGAVPGGDGLAAVTAATLPAAFAVHRPRLRRVVAARLLAGLRKRVDPSDVLQDVYLDAMRQVDQSGRAPRAGVYVWLLGLVRQRLAKVYRRHCGAARRAVGREVPIAADSSAAGRPAGLVDRDQPPDAAARRELRRRVEAALARLPAADREVILLRDFDGLTNNEAAAALGLTPSAATMRYGRALHRLKELLAVASPTGG